MTKNTLVTYKIVLSIPLKSLLYVFRTCFMEPGVTSGIHYWELTMDSRTENEMKIGVSFTVRKIIFITFLIL